MDNGGFNRPNPKTPDSIWRSLINRKPQGERTVTEKCSFFLPRVICGFVYLEEGVHGEVFPVSLLRWFCVGQVCLCCFCHRSRKQPLCLPASYGIDLLLLSCHISRKVCSQKACVLSLLFAMAALHNRFGLCSSLFLRLFLVSYFPKIAF